MKIPTHNFVKNKHFEITKIEDQKGYDFTFPHRHKYFEIMFFKKGGGTHLIDFENYQIKDYSIHIIPPSKVHLLTKSKTTFAHVIVFEPFFYSSQELLDSFPCLSYFHSSPVIELTEKDFEPFEEVISNMIQESERQIPSQIILQSYLNIVLAGTERHLESTRNEKITPFGKQFLQLLENHYKQENKVGFYADALNTSEKTLYDKINKEFGNSPKTMIQNRILLECKRLLTHTLKPIKEIAFEFHFYDEAHFTRFFLKNQDCTPSDFRSKYRSTKN